MEVYFCSDSCLRDVHRDNFAFTLPLSKILLFYVHLTLREVRLQSSIALLNQYSSLMDGIPNIL